MFPLPLTKVDNLKPLLEEAIVEFHTEKRTTIDFLLNRIKVGYAGRSIDGYVDNADDPKHVLILEKSHGGATNETLLEVRFIFSTKSERGNKEALAAFEKQINNYAEIFSCDAILASSWTYGGTPRIDAFWRSLGFVQQEIVYVKVTPENKTDGK